MSTGFTALAAQDAPEEWRTQMDPEMTRNIAVRLGCQKEQVRQVLAFESPECKMALDYQKFLQQRNMTGDVGIIIVNMEDFLSARGRQGLTDWIKAMQDTGRPPCSLLTYVTFIAQ